MEIERAIVNRNETVQISSQWIKLISKMRKLLTRLQGLCSTIDDVGAFEPLFIIACASWMGFIGGGRSNTTSSSFSMSWWACDVFAVSNLAVPWSPMDFSRKRWPGFCTNAWWSSSVTDVANLNVFSEPFFKNVRSIAEPVAVAGGVAFVLSTFPWDSLRSGGGNHFLLFRKQKIVKNNW